MKTFVNLMILFSALAASAQTSDLTIANIPRNSLVTFTAKVIIPARHRILALNFGEGNPMNSNREGAVYCRLDFEPDDQEREIWPGDKFRVAEFDSNDRWGIIKLTDAKYPSNKSKLSIACTEIVYWYTASRFSTWDDVIIPRRMLIGSTRANLQKVQAVLQPYLTISLDPISAPRRFQ